MDRVHEELLTWSFDDPGWLARWASAPGAWRGALQEEPGCLLAASRARVVRLPGNECDDFGGCADLITHRAQGSDGVADGELLRHSSVLCRTARLPGSP